MGLVDLRAGRQRAAGSRIISATASTAAQRIFIQQRHRTIHRPPADTTSALPGRRTNSSPVQVTRVNPIPNTPPGASTREFNAYYQQLLKGTVWQNYQLVVTQWPFNPGIGEATVHVNAKRGVYPHNAGAPFRWTARSTPRWKLTFKPRTTRPARAATVA